MNRTTRQRSAQPDGAALCRTRTLLDPNLALLAQAADLCTQLTDSCFRAPCRDLGDSTIGQHMRHSLDHFERFITGLGDGRIDYDDRARSHDLERERVQAAAAARSAAERLLAVATDVPADQPLEVTQACAVEGQALPERSTCGRELQFLVSHTVHHFAMIAAICRQHGLAMPAEFGVAPSTLRYRAENCG